MMWADEPSVTQYEMIIKATSQPPQCPTSTSTFLGLKNMLGRKHF